MRLYNEIIHDILTSLEKQDKHILPVGAAADPVSRDWQDAGKAMMILQPDMAYELGGHNLPAVGNTLVTTEEGFVAGDEIVLIGKDLPDIAEDTPYARIALVRVAEDSIGTGDQLYNTIQNIGYFRYHIYPKGFMLRVSSSNDTKTKDRYYLKCATHHIAKDACEGAFISVKALEDAVLSEIHRMSKEYLDIETLEKNLKLDTDIRRQQEQCEKKIETYQKKQQTYQKGISQAYLDRVSGILTEKEYLELTEEFRQGKQLSEKLMESEKKRLTELTERLEKGDERGKRILKYINPEFLTKEIVEELIDHIVVGKKSKETGEIPVEIHWNF